MRWPLTEPALARTYRSSYEDPYEAVLDYRRVRSYQQSHPEAGSYMVAKTLELPRSRVRPWMEGAKPDALTAIETASERGWLSVDTTDPDDDVVEAFVVLLAGVFAGGSIRNDGFVPHWTDDSGPTDRLTAALGTLGIDYRSIHAHDPKRATELVPRGDGSILGRALSVLGAPSESKNESSMNRLPDYLFALPTTIQHSFISVYVAYRKSGTQRTVRLQESRSGSFHTSLADLIGAVVSNPDSVTVGEHGVYISGHIREELSL